MNIEMEIATQSSFSTIRQWIRDDEEYFYWCGTDFSFSEEDEFIWNKINNHKNIVTIHFTLEKEIIGYGELHIIDTNSKWVRLVRIIIKPALRNKGYGKKIVKKLNNYAREKLNAERIDLVVFEHNINATCCYLKSNFSFESKAKNVKIFNNKKLSTYTMVHS